MKSLHLSLLMVVLGLIAYSLTQQPAVALEDVHSGSRGANMFLSQAGSLPPTDTATPTPALRDEGATAVPSTPSPTPSASPERSSGKASDVTTDTTTGKAAARGLVTGDVVNLRAGPGLEFQVVGQVVLNQTVQIVGGDEEGTWWQICCPAASEEPVWISADYVETDLALERDATPAAEPEISAFGQATGAGPSAAATGDDASRPSPSSTLEGISDPNLPPPGNFSPPGDLNPLTGLPLPAERRNQRPVITCINNDPAARPQFGLSQADVLYEYLMEGRSITRFSGIFYAEAVERIGPVRSARLINYYLGSLYDSALFCSGASDYVRYALKREAPFPYLDVDLDDPSNDRYTVSIGRNYRTRVRTSTASFRQWLAKWEEERPAAMRGFTFGPLPEGGSPAQTITIPYPTATGSDVEYRYDPASKRYLRFQGGEPHADGNTGLHLGLENVIVQYVLHEETEIIEDSLGGRSIRINLFGADRAMLFRDGLAFEGSWQSSSRGDTPHFFDQNGREIPLKPGKTWISVVPTNFEIKY